MLSGAIQVSPDGQDPTTEEPVAPSRAAFDTFVRHLRANFEDIHEVSMRFHRVDPTLNGMMVIEMTWTDGRMEDAKVLENETNEAEAEAILEVLRRWRIDDLNGPVTFSVPFRFRIVGSDDPGYQDKGILTGSVRAADGTAIANAQIELLSESQSTEPIRARSNREGVFIRTLVPPGTWNVLCKADGFKDGRVEAVTLRKGEHRIIEFDLEPVRGDR